MSDDKGKAGKPDRIRINVHQPHELRHWCKAFGVTRATLLEAVAAVGPMVRKVRAYLIAKIKSAT